MRALRAVAYLTNALQVRSLVPGEEVCRRARGGISMPASVDQSRGVNATPGAGTDGPDCFALPVSGDGGAPRDLSPRKANEVTNVGTDRHQLSNIAEQARTEMGVETLDAVADRGYYASEEISKEIEAAMAQWGREPNVGLIVMPDPATNAHRKLINELAARYRLPVIHAVRAAAAEGGLNVFRQAAVYADRILKGADPADLPISLPTKFELVINLTTAKTLGIDVPMSLMVRADEMLD
jgi:ABC transporter substrate binding protein